MFTPVLFTATLALCPVRLAGAVAEPWAALADPDPAARVAAIGALADRDDPAVRPALLRVLADPELAVQIAAAAALAGGADEALLDPLVRGLEGEDVTWRRGCALALAGLPEERAYRALAGQCRQGRLALRWQVAEAIGRARNRRFIPLMQAALREGDDWRVQEVAVLALAGMHAELGIGPLLPALESGDEYIRRIACWRLGSIGDPGALPHLVDGILRKYDTYETRIGAAVAIDAITGGASGAGVSEMARDPAKFLAWWEQNRDRYGQ